MNYGNPKVAPGHFRADQIPIGDRYELSHGHPIYVHPTGGRGSGAVAPGASAITSDPDVREAGIDTGYSPDPGTLRAPDIAVGNVPDQPGWVRGVPPLAVEYADTGQNEEDLADKIEDLLGAGTQVIWVVRLVGPRRVEIHERGKAMRLALPGDELLAPGILKNPLPVAALFDAQVSAAVTLRNLLQREGYQDLDAVLESGRNEGRDLGRAQERERLIRRLEQRFGPVTPEQHEWLDALDPEVLLDGLLNAETLDDLRPGSRG